MLRKIFKYFIWTIGIVLVLAVLTVGIAYIWTISRSVESVRPADYSWEKGMSREQIAQEVEKLLGQMTLEEKVAQLYGDRRALPKIGLPIIFQGRFGKIQSGYNERLDIPPFVFTDGPRGVTVARKGTCFPVAMARGASWDRDLEYRIGDAIGKEARASGANYFGGLCINLLRHPAWGRAQETFGEDPHHLGEMGVALMQGVQQHNVMACAKHYALNNIENSRFYVNVEADERTLREVYLPQFRKCVDNGVASVMSAYNDFRGELCGHNDYLLDQVLRQEWGFTGFVTSDWMNGLEDTEEGIKAGMDVEMPLPKHYTVKKIKKQLEEGTITAADIDDMVRHVLQTKLWYITRTDPMSYQKKLVASQAHRDLALEAAEKSMVLLKNEGNLLPLDKSTIKNIAVIGKLADVPSIGDHGSSRVNPSYVVTPLQGLKKYLGREVEVTFSDGADLEAAQKIARTADVVLIIAGYEHSDEGEYFVISSDMDYVSRPRTQQEEAKRKKNKKWFERFVGGDRLDLGLKERDQRLIEALASENDKTVVALIAGSAVVMEEWERQVSAILMMWYAGMEGGNALANVLFGAVNPSGKLPLTIPKRAEHLPPFDPFAEQVEYGYYHGYTLLDKEHQDAAFSFGFGLSYTQFVHDSLNILTPELTVDDVLNVRVPLTNTGDRMGAEVTQLYVGFANSTVDRPVKLLRAFKKTELAPGETKVVELRVPTKDLAWYNPRNQAWEVERMPYELYVGSSSQKEDLLVGSFVVK